MLNEMSDSPSQSIEAPTNISEPNSPVSPVNNFLTPSSITLKHFNKVRWRTLLFITILFIVSFQLRWWYIKGTTMIKPIRADAWEYTAIAYNLAEHGAYSTDTGVEVKSKPNARDPGYPIFLAGIIKATKPRTLKEFFYTTAWIQSILGATTVIISYFLARFFLPPVWSGAVSVLTMLSPHLISMTNYVLAETLFTFLLQIALILNLFAIKKKNKSWLLAGAGFAFGLAMCVKSVLQLFPIALAAMIFFFFRHKRKNAIKYSIILLTTSFILFAPWKIWIHFAFKGTESPSLLKATLYVGSYIGLVYDSENQRKYGRGMPYRDDPNYDNVVNGGYGSIFEEIGKRFRENPIDYSSWYLLGKPAMFWGWTMVHGGGDINVYPNLYTWYDRNRLMNLTKKLMQLLHPLIIILMHFGAVLFIIRRANYSKTQFIMMSSILILLIYFLAIHTILVPAPRYSIPLRPLVYFIAVLGIAELTGKPVRKKGSIDAADQ